MNGKWYWPETLYTGLIWEALSNLYVSMHVHSCISKFYALIGQFLDAYNSRTINATELNLCLYVYLELLYQLHLLSCICGHPLLNAGLWLVNFWLLIIQEQKVIWNWNFVWDALWNPQILLLVHSCVTTFCLATALFSDDWYTLFMLEIHTSVSDLEYQMLKIEDELQRLRFKGQGKLHPLF